MICNVYIIGLIGQEKKLFVCTFISIPTENMPNKFSPFVLKSPFSPLLSDRYNLYLNWIRCHYDQSRFTCRYDFTVTSWFLLSSVDFWKLIITIVGQLRPSIVRKMLKLWDFALSLIKHKQNFSDMPHSVAFPRWPPMTLRVSHGSKIETCSDFSENSVKLFVLS